MYVMATDAADPCGGGAGTLPVVLRREPPIKQPRKATAAEDDGTPLNDELLLAIFDGVPDLADLVRVAATCRRWRRLVSGEAAFLCRTPRRLPGRFISNLAIGFLHQQTPVVAPRFVLWAAESQHIHGRLCRQPSLSLSALAQPGSLPSFGSRRIVASRNGLLAVEARGGKRDGALRLSVCDTMSGAVHVLPPLAGTGGGHAGHCYACAVITAADCNEGRGPPLPSSYFRLVVLRNTWRHGGSTSTTLHSYSPDDGGGWSDEVNVTHGVQLSGKQLCLMRGGGGVARGGTPVYWLAKNVVVVLELATLRLAVHDAPRSANGQNLTMANTLPAFSPEGKLYVFQFDRMSLSPARRKRRVSIGVYVRGGWSGWHCKESIQVDQYLPDDTTKVRLRCFCERSRVVFFTAVAGENDRLRSEVYALSLETRVAEKVASQAGDGDWGELHGYEVDQSAYLQGTHPLPKGACVLSFSDLF